MSKVDLNTFIHDNFMIDGIAALLPIIISDKSVLGSKSNIKTIKELMDFQQSKKCIDIQTATHVELRPRLIGNIACIDVDGITENGDVSLIELMNTIPDFLKGLPYTLSRKKKLPHFYMRINDYNLAGLKPTYVDCFKGMKADLLVNHVWEKINARVYNYTGSLPEVSWNDLSQILNKDITGESKQMEERDTTRIDTEEGIVITKEEVIDHINNLDTYLYRDSKGAYEHYLRIVWSVNNYDKELYPLMLDWTSKSPYYKEERWFRNIWDSSCQYKDVTVGTLLYYSKISNSDAYKNIRGIHKDNMFDIEYTEIGMAKLFILLYKDRLVYNSDGRMYIHYLGEWREDYELIKGLVLESLTLHLKDRLSGLKRQTQSERVVQEISKLSGFIGNLTRIRYASEILNNCKSILRRNCVDVEFDTGDEQKYNIHFKNGCFDLKNKVFRERTVKDYVISVLPYDYLPEVSVDILDRVEEIFKKIHPELEQREFALSYLAYCLNGSTTKCIYKNNVGFNASNGKTTELNIHNKCFPIYTRKLDKSVFNINNGVRHKFIIDLLNEPLRLAYIEELDTQELDTGFIKDLVDGSRITCQVMYRTSINKPVQCKLVFCTNKLFSMKLDAGIARRGRLQYYRSIFADVEKDDPVNHIYRKDEELASMFDLTEYKNAYFHLLLRYTDSLKIPVSAHSDFNDTAREGDALRSKFEEFYEITGNVNDCVPKTIIEKDMQGFKWIDILSMAKSIGLNYMRDRRCEGYRGCLVGLKRVSCSTTVDDL